MKLLIVCQALDTKHPILGFFHRWVEEFSKHFEEITVVALQVGEYSLPENVVVHSLGKERGGGRFAYIMRFYKIVFSLQNYDAVFVHMNPEYVLLMGWWWRLLRKKVGLWYNHTVGSFWLKIAQPFTNIVFYTSPFAYTARYKNARKMPAGIDTDVFKPQSNIEKIPQSVYFQGRVAPAKRVHFILESFAQLYDEKKVKLLTIVGPEDEIYTKPLKEQYKDLIQSGVIVFKGPVSHTETPKLYAAHEISINLTDDGNYDKTVLESLACGTPVVTSSKAFMDAPVILCDAPTAENVAQALRTHYEPSGDLVQYVKKHHSLTVLAKSVQQIFNTRT